jgi:uncharacterized protein YdaL
MSEGDRYLGFCDLLFDALASTTPEQHRALVRLEDIDPTYDTNTLKSVADWLKSQNVPFGFQIIPYYVDPLNANGLGTNITLQSKPAMVRMIKYMQSQGGVMMCHGYTHQYDSTANPYAGVTGDDCEFYRITMNSDHSLNFQGPVAEDSPAWAQARFSGTDAVQKCRLSDAGIHDLSFLCSVGSRLPGCERIFYRRFGEKALLHWPAFWSTNKLFPVNRAVYALYDS